MFQCQRPCRVSKTEAQNPQDEVQEGQRLMIIKLERYTKVGELLLGNRTTGLQGHVCYWDRGQRVSVTTVAVSRGVKEMGMGAGHRSHTIGLQVGHESRYAHNHCRAIKSALANHKMEIDWKERGLGPSGHRSSS